MKGILIKNKSGQEALGIASVGAIAITIVVAVIVLGLGSTILENIQGGQSDDSATTLDNESWTWTANNTLQPFVQDRVVTSSVIVYCNVTTLPIATNYTVEGAGVRPINLSAGGGEDYAIDHCNFNMTYSYNIGSEAYNSSDYGMSGLNTMAEFVPTIAIVAIAAIIIGIVLVFFGRKKEGEM